MLAMSRVAGLVLFPLGILAAILSVSRSARADIWPGTEWAVSTPESQRMSGAALDQAVARAVCEPYPPSTVILGSDLGPCEHDRAQGP